MEHIWQIIILSATSFSGWLFGKLQTRREQKKSDLQIIEGAISPLLTSIKELTEHNNTLVQQYLEEQSLRLQMQEASKMLRAERDDLASQVSRLVAKVDKLEKTIQKLTKNEKELLPAAH